MAGVSKHYGLQLSTLISHRDDWCGMVNRSLELSLLSQFRNICFTIVASIDGESRGADSITDLSWFEVPECFCHRIRNDLNQVGGIVVDELLLSLVQKIHGREVAADHWTGVSVRREQGNLTSVHLVCLLNRVADRHADIPADAHEVKADKDCRCALRIFQDEHFGPQFVQCPFCRFIATTIARHPHGLFWGDVGFR